MCCPLCPLVLYCIIDRLQLSSVLYIWGKVQVQFISRATRVSVMYRWGGAIGVLEYNEAGLVYSVSYLESQYPKGRAIWIFPMRLV